MAVTATKRPRGLKGKVKRHLRALARAKANYKLAEEILEELLDNGLKAGDLVKVADEQYAVLNDNFAGCTRVYRAHGISKYEFKVVHSSLLPARAA